MSERHGGDLIAEVLANHGVRHLFTLCGGHISPILTGAEARGLRVIDVRDEASAVFAADAVARVTGGLGVAAVTAGPGVTNAITAIKNAQMAQSPLLLFGGSTATLLKGRGSLQDVDQLSIMKTLTKWAGSARSVPSLTALTERAIAIAREGVPGPVFLEVPVDLLYPEHVVRGWYEKEAGLGKGKGLGAKALELYIRGHLFRQFRAPAPPELTLPRIPRRTRSPNLGELAAKVAQAARPVLVIGSQTMVGVREPERIAAAVRALGVPVFLGGMARGLLGRADELQFRHARSAALKEADLVIVAGFPFDFRLGYGRSIGKATIIAANLSAAELRKNRRPEHAVEMHAGDFLVELAAHLPAPRPARAEWFAALRQREEARDAEIAAAAQPAGERLDPLHLLLRVEAAMADDAALVVDGGDFVATASYVVRPRAPLAWLDPGVFGTLGVGGGFAVGAAAVRPERELWLLWGDGSSAYSLAELDTCVRHGLAPIAIIGNDASWAQIAREQVEVLGTPLGTVLQPTRYDQVAEGYGAVGMLLDDPAKIDETLAKAKELARQGRPVCINAMLRPSEFRKGSISI
ncbi:MAG: thiamine pyrophosphate-binding protein [Kofleriaceae bacterium]